MPVNPFCLSFCSFSWPLWFFPSMSGSVNKESESRAMKGLKLTTAFIKCPFCWFHCSRSCCHLIKLAQPGLSLNLQSPSTCLCPLPRYNLDPKDSGFTSSYQVTVFWDNLLFTGIWYSILLPGWNLVLWLILLVDFNPSSCLLSAALTWLLELLHSFFLDRKECGPIMSISGVKGGTVSHLWDSWHTNSWLVTAILLASGKEARGLSILHASS